MHESVRHTEEKMQQAIEHLKQELGGVRTGRANPLLFENVMVDVYGASMRVKDLAQTSTPEPRQVLITPFDPQTAPAIAKGIEKANLNVMPSVDGHLIRIQIAPMDGSTRTQMQKLCKKYCEDAKVRIRQVRKEGNDRIKKLKNDKSIEEDQLHKLEKEIQDLTDKLCKECDILSQAREAEVMSI